jgi:hypothetical protein
MSEPNLPTDDVGHDGDPGAAMAVLPMVPLEQIRRFCARYRCPWEPTAWLETVVAGLSVTIVERRTPTSSRGSTTVATKRPVARLEFDHERREWSLHRRTGGERWTRYWPAPATSDIVLVLEALTRDADGVFWPRPVPAGPGPRRG